MKKENLSFALILTATFNILNLQVNAQGVTKPSEVIQIKKAVADKLMPHENFPHRLIKEFKKENRHNIRNNIKFNSANNNLSGNAITLTETKQCIMPPLLSTNFEGNPLTPYYLPPVGYYASECNIAISNAGKIVSISNGWINYYNESGKKTFSDSLQHFCSGLIDSRLLYDPKQDRFILVSSWGFSDYVSIFDGYGLVFAFSKTNDPIDGWNFYFIPESVYSNNDGTSGDYEQLGISDDELFITEIRQDKQGHPAYSLILQAEKNAGYTGAATINLQKYNVTQTKITNGSVVPVSGGSTTHGPNMYFMTANETGHPSNKYWVFEITNTIASGKAVLNAYGPVHSNLFYSGAGASYQQGDLQLVDVNASIDDFAQNAFYENGIIQFCQNTNVNGKASVCIGRISGIPNNLSCTAKTISDPNLYLSFPSIAYAGKSSSDNSAIVGIEHTGTTTFPGLSAVLVNSNFDISVLTTVKSGNDTINALWGDYSGICRRYNHPGECWFEGQYGSTTFPNINWIAKLKTQECPILNVTRATDIKSSIYTDITLSVSPNPFSHLTNVSFSVLETGKVSVKIYDMSGRLIKILLNESIQQGNHQIIWNATDDNGNAVSAGVYLLQLNTSNQTQIKKIIVTK